MELHEQTISLDTAKKLKELGVKQSGALFYWDDTGTDGEWQLIIPLHFESGNADFKIVKSENAVAALTVSELELLVPNEINIAYKNGKPRDSKHWRTMKRAHHGYVVGYHHANYSTDSWIDIHGDTFAEAFGKALVHLIENKLVGV